ncbi:MAG TPA: 5'-nucleotidase [Armatimonadota bacterium]|jgi:2',3'-cyclic-nucleotide 2'-phosphodiesterase/3'-nucleotidase/5'-nucleotidase
MRRNSVWTIWAFSVALAVGCARANAEPLGQTSTDISGAGARTREAVAGNFLADAVRASARADAAVIPADAITDATVAKGPIARADVKTLLEDPDDAVAILNITGAQLKAVLERGVSACPKPFDGFLQVSGLTIEFNTAKPAGQRVTAVRVNGSPLEPGKRYQVATLVSLADGGLGYYNLWEKKDVSEPGPAVLEAAANYVKALKTVSPREEGRVSAK